ncbi:MAG: hypothetical protein LV468_01875 [Candidatus Nitrosotenuis sp.]|nr:hypothetical protein [Candidatus Nitrosotenuis sp.]
MSEAGNKNNTVNDNHQFIIALIIVCSFVIIIGLAVLTDAFSKAENIIMTFSAFVGTIIGFYFGQRPVQNLTEEVAKANRANSKLKSDAEVTLNETDDLQNDVRKVKGELENLKRLIGEL